MAKLASFIEATRLLIISRPDFVPCKGYGFLQDSFAETDLNIFLMHTYDTVAEAVNGLKQRGYGIDFNLKEDCLHCDKTPLSLRPSEFEITEVYRFEGNSDPADEAVVYAIESRQGQKGVLVNGFGVSADALDEEMIEKLQFRH